jgi:hypothetical protein
MSESEAKDDVNDGGEATAEASGDAPAGAASQRATVQEVEELIARMSIHDHSPGVAASSTRTSPSSGSQTKKRRRKKDLDQLRNRALSHEGSREDASANDNASSSDASNGTHRL